MKIIILFAIALCAYAADEKMEEKEKRQTHEGHLGAQHVYRAARKQEQVAPVEEHQEEEKSIGRSDEQYRPGQVYSLNSQELIEFQQERKAPVSNNQQLQQLYINPQQDDKQDLQQFYFLEPQVGRQVSLHPSHTVITRPTYSANGGEASVGAALAVSDTGANSANTFDHDLLALLGQSQGRQEEARSRQDDPRPQTYPQPQPQPTPTVQSVAPQYQQVDRYVVSKPSKKITKSHSKVQSTANPTQLPSAPQQYLIETTNVQQQQPQEQQVQYRIAPQPQRFSQALRYVPSQQAQEVPQQVYYEQHETQGLKIVAAPKLQEPEPQSQHEPQHHSQHQPQHHPQHQSQHQPQHQPQHQSQHPSQHQSQHPSQHQSQQQSQHQQQQQPRTQIAYRLLPQYTQPEISSKQYRIIEGPHPQQVRPEHRQAISSHDRPVTYLRRFQEPEKQRSVKIYEPIQEQPLQQQQVVGEQYYLRPVYRTNDQRVRYELPPMQLKAERQRVLEPTKPPHSTIYVNKNLAPRKVLRPLPSLREQNVKLEQPAQDLQHRHEHAENVNIEQHGQNLAEQRPLPPPKNNKAYTPEEFAALVAAGYAVTPVPVSALSLGIAQSRSSEEAVTSLPVMMAYPRGRLSHRRHQYLPLRGDDAP